jgi:Putative Ig domain
VVSLTRRGENVSILRNLGYVVPGPVLSFISAVVYLVCSGLGCTKDKPPTNPYTMAMVLLAGIPGALQLFRIGLGANPGNKQFDAVRGGAIATTNFLAGGVSAFMLIAGAALSGVEIDGEQTLRDGKLGELYEAQLEATGGDYVFNTPLKNWEVVDGNLPAGLTLDAESGEIRGIPTAAGTATFHVRCSDSYGPPQYAKPTQLTITVAS